ncbi:MAG: PLP-dependent aminotransferase family protein [Cocleimonas sp.]
MAKGQYKKIVDVFVQKIRSGQLPAGTRLPTHRKLAADEGIALVTASRVYTELEQMGLVSGETGRGTFVRETGLPDGHGIDQNSVEEGMIDLNFNYPALPSQTDLLRTSLRKLASSGDLESLLRYQPHAGRMKERVIIARHLLSRGLSTEADWVSIVSGAQHGLAVSVMATLQPGDVVAVDSLTYPGFKVLAEAHRLELAPIPATANGPDLEYLEQLCKKRRVRAIYTMPTLHNPLGWVTSLDEREALILIARKYGLIIIEDAAYAFLEENAPPPISALAPDICIYVSGLSKNVATGLRVGFVVSPPHWSPMIERSIRATTWNTPALMTAITCDWIEDGTINLLEKEKRRDAIIRQSKARKILNGLDYIGHPASYFLWLPLGEEVRADQVSMVLIKSNISVSTAEPFATSDSTPHAFRIALGSVDIDTLCTALKKVKAVIDDHSF